MQTLPEVNNNKHPQPIRVDVWAFLKKIPDFVVEARLKGEQAGLDILAAFEYEQQRAQYDSGDSKPRKLWMDWGKVGAWAYAISPLSVKANMYILSTIVEGIAVSMMRQKSAKWIAERVTFINSLPFIHKAFCDAVAKQELFEGMINNFKNPEHNDGVPF
jgi:hypothetical protein